MPIYKDRDTKQDLLESAVKHFALSGFDGTSIRTIIAEAKATLSSISYHFGGKEELYIDTIRYVIMEKSDFGHLFKDIDVEHQKAEIVKDLFYQNIRRLFDVFHGGKQADLYGKLLSRCMLESRQTVIELFQDCLIPVEERLKQIIKYFNPTYDEMDVSITIHNLWGQANFYSLAKAFIYNDHGFTEFTPEFLDKVSHLITDSIMR